MISKEDLEFIIKNGKRSNEINGYHAEGIIYLSYNFVKIELPSLLQKGDLQAIVKEFFKEVNHTIKGKIKVSEVMSFVLWLKDELERVYGLESEYLQSPPDNDLREAGIEELNELGELNIIDSLAGGDMLKWEAIKKLPYHMIFDKQRKTVIEAKIQKRLSEIMKRKYKSNK